MFNFRQPLPIELTLRVGGGHLITPQSCRAFRVTIFSDRHHLSAQALAHAITLEIRMKNEKSYDSSTPHDTCCCAVENQSTVLLYLFGSGSSLFLKVR